MLLDIKMNNNRFHFEVETKLVPFFFGKLNSKNDLFMLTFLIFFFLSVSSHFDNN